MRKFPKQLKTSGVIKEPVFCDGVLLLKCLQASVQRCPSDQAKALVLLHGLGEATAEDLFGLIAGHVQQVVAGVGHRQVVFLRRGGLDGNAQALHAVDRNPVAASEENCRRDNHRPKSKKFCL